MRKKIPPFFLLIPIIFAVSFQGYAQLWSGIVNPTRAIDWSTAGIAGGIPSGAWTQAGATLSAGSGDQTSAIQAALNACGTNHYVLLAAGTFLLNGGLTVPSNCALRGSGASQTILNAKSSNANDIMLGTNWPTFSNTVSITGGTAQGSTSITVASTSGISVGSYVVISQLNDGVIVNQNGSEGPCTWCDGGQTSDGSRVQGQISQVTSVSGAAIGINPGLFVAYTRTPTAVTLSGMVQYAGVENLQIYTNDTHTSNPSNIEIESCAYCWVSGVESNYTDGDHIDIDFSYHFMVVNSYFSGTWGNGPGQFDHGLAIRTKSTGGVIQNNIFERTGILEPQRGAAGNVLAFNYMTGMYSNSSPNFLSGNIETHGAHVQYNLLEGNVVSKIDLENIWGSNADNTLFRNWVTGADIACNPYNAMAPPRQTVVCTPMGAQGSAGVNGWWEIQFVTAVNSSFSSTYQNFVGDVIGSAAMAALNQYNNPSDPMGHTAVTNAPSVRSYDTVAYGFAFGFGEASDTGGVPIANGVGCDGSYSYPCESTLPASTAFYYQEFNNISGSAACSGSCGNALPPSFYLSGKPSWWGSLPWPAIGPDITGGTGPGGHTSLTASNPAQNCYLNVMGGVVGGRSPLTFNPSDCYASSTSQIAPPTQLKAVVH
jgi:Pectate lyase superfamily protein